MPTSGNSTNLPSGNIAGRELPRIASHVTFLYYDDLTAAAFFYSSVLGLPKLHDDGWVMFFQVTPASSIGIVDRARGTYRPGAGHGVLVSIETPALEQWYQRLLLQGAEFLTHPLPDDDHPLASTFMVRDPGGYAVEFFRWKQPRPGATAI